MPFCETCKDWYPPLAAHTCAPFWEVSIDDGDWYKVRARDERMAAERACEIGDQRGDYTIAHDGAAECVLVRKPGDTEVKQYYVEVDTSPVYIAHELPKGDTCEE